MQQICHFLILMLVLVSCSTQKSIEEKETWKASLKKDGEKIEVIFYIKKDHSKTTVSFSGHSQPNVDRELGGAGWITSRIVRNLSDFHIENGALMHFVDGEIYPEGNTDSFNVSLLYRKKEHRVLGIFEDKRFEGVLKNSDNKEIGEISMERINRESLPLRNYPEIYAQARDTLEKRIYDAKIKNEEEWTDFKEDMNRVATEIKDDLHFKFVFSLLNIDYAPFRLTKPMNVKLNGDTLDYYTIEEINNQSVKLNVHHICGNGDSIDQAIEEIKEKNYDNLVVDWGNSCSGQGKGGKTLINWLVNEESESGVFLTQKNLNKEENEPLLNEHNQFVSLADSGLDNMYDTGYLSNGFIMHITPVKPSTFDRIFLITSGKIKGIGEAIVHYAKSDKRIITVGETTGGYPLIFNRFELDEGFVLRIPTLSYFTAEGEEVVENGITPEYNLPYKQALENVLDEVSE